jgi:hypothetical protein
VSNPFPPRDPGPKDSPRAPDSAPTQSKMDRRDSLIASLAAEGHAQPVPRPQPDPYNPQSRGVTAFVRMERSWASPVNALSGQVIITAGGDEPEREVRIAQVTPYFDPRGGGPTPTPIRWDWVSGGSAPVPRDESFAVAFSVLFITPQSGPAVTYTVRAVVQFADGSSVEARPATIEIVPPV